MATLGTLRSRVRYALGNRDDLTTGDGLTALDGWINAAQREIAHNFRFDDLEFEDTSLVTNAVDRFVTIPNGVYAVLSVYNVTSSRFIDPFPGGWPEYERIVSPSQRNRPTEWLRYNNRIYFRDPPDLAYSLRCGFWLEPNIMAAESDIPQLPEVWHDGIAILGKRNGWRDIGDDRRAQSVVDQEWSPFIATVRTPSAIESHNPKRRGMKLRHHIQHPTIGV